MVLQKVWKQLKEADKQLVVYPWGNKESKKLSVLKKVEDLPERVPAIQEYFNGAFPQKAGGVMYVVFIWDMTGRSRKCIARSIGGWFRKDLDGTRRLCNAKSWWLLGGCCTR